MKILGLLLAGALALPAVTPEAAAEAEKEMFAARFDRAAELYSRLLKEDPHWAPGYYGLVRSLLGAYRAPEAYTAGEDAVRNAPDKAESLTAAGMEQFRAGDLAKSEADYLAALKVNSRYPGALAGLASIRYALSKFKSQRVLILAAAQASPNDPELMLAQASTLKGKDHIAALERALAIYDPTTRESRTLRAHISTDRALGDRKLRQLTTPYQSYALKLTPLLNGPKYEQGVGLEVRLNKHSVILMLDTGASGISLAPKAAEKAGLETLGQESSEARGIGDEKPQESFQYLAHEVTIGNLTYSDYPVHVFRGAQMPSFDGLIGGDVFARFLITIEFSNHRLLLEPYPTGQPKDDDEPQDSPDPLPDRFFRAIRFGSHMTVFTSVNDHPPRLFLMDSGSNRNLIDTGFARESTKVRSDVFSTVKGIQGSVKDVGRADEVSLKFAGFHQGNSNVLAMDLEKMSDGFGARIVGILGMTVLSNLQVTIDYRYGAVRFEHK